MRLTEMKLTGTDRFVTWVGRQPKWFGYLVNDFIYGLEYSWISPYYWFRRLFKFRWCWNNLTIRLNAEVHKGDLVLCDFWDGIGKLRGIEDAPDDYYYVIDYIDRGTEYLTAVTGFISLRERYRGRFERYLYERLDYAWERHWVNPVNVKARKEFKKREKIWAKKTMKKIFG